MSWGYWGIVIGVGSLVMMMFLTLAILYPNHAESYGRFNKDEEQDVRSDEERKAGSRAAA
jgi:hypothetical protein